MGMAASQARYLALVARKSNCEYEGQQINQARTVLSNQTANLFNQMLGLQVPVPPSTRDFTKTQYSFTDGINASVIDKWEQLATPDDNGYNYVVEYHYEANVYKGFIKQMNDPQIQFTYNTPTTDEDTAVHDIYNLQKIVREKQDDYDKKYSAYEAEQSKAKTLINYKDRDMYAEVSNVTLGEDGKYSFDYKSASGTEGSDVYIPYNDDTKATIDTIVAVWKNMGITVQPEDLYLSQDGENIAFKTDLSAINAGTSKTLPRYEIGQEGTIDTSVPYSIYGEQANLAKLKSEASAAQDALNRAEENFNTYNKPEYVGNSKLTSLGKLEKEQLAEIKQIMRSMDEQGVDVTNFYRCFQDSLSINEEGYRGGIYTFERDGVTYYTTYYDLVDTASNNDFMNPIDNQAKLNYYHANYVKENIYDKQKAILDTDSNGRFKTVRFEDGGQYTLNFEEITDDEAYQDAMNQYYYKSAEYDKMVRDINAKTSIIHQEDQQLELRLKQLDTEQNALSNEIDAVSKVVKDNVDKSFKTFGG